jgi:hypothetical protein
MLMDMCSLQICILVGFASATMGGRVSQAYQRERHFGNLPGPNASKQIRMKRYAGTDVLVCRWCDDLKSKGSICKGKARDGLCHHQHTIEPRTYARTFINNPSSAPDRMTPLDQDVLNELLYLVRSCVVKRASSLAFAGFFERSRLRSVLATTPQHSCTPFVIVDYIIHGRNKITNTTVAPANLKNTKVM